MKYFQKIILVMGICIAAFGIASANEFKVCPMNYDPVCGVDGNTYGNTCAAGDTKIAYTGECGSKKVYDSSEAFLKAEGNSCKVATDGCNTVMITDGKLGAMTLMYCEDTYGENGKEQWSCIDDGAREDYSYGGLSKEERAQHQNLSEKLGDDTTLRVSNVILNYGNKIVEKYQDNPEKSKQMLKKASQMLEEKRDAYGETHSADSIKSEKDTMVHDILTYAILELKMIHETWFLESSVEYIDFELDMDMKDEK